MPLEYQDIDPAILEERDSEYSGLKLDMSDSTRGVMKFDSGDEFDGLKENGKPKFGTLIKKNGIRYVGSFNAEGVPTGEATIIYPNKHKFEGKQHNFVLDFGVMYLPNGDRHCGGWEDGLPAPDGLRKYQDGRRNTGPIEVSSKHKGSKRFKMWFTINNGIRVCENWNFDMAPFKENEDYISPTSLELEKSLMIACSVGNQNVVITILTKYPELAAHAVDHRANKSAPAIVVAAANGHTEIVRLLLVRGADPECANTDMENAFHAAVKGGHADTLKLLVKMTSQFKFSAPGTFPHPMDCENYEGKTPFKMASDLWDQSSTADKAAAVMSERYENCLRVLIRGGASPKGVPSIHVVLDVKSQFFTAVSLFFVPPTMDVLVQRYIREVEVLPGYGTVDERQRIISPLIASGGFFGMDKDSPY